MSSKQAFNYYRLGEAIGFFDPHSDRLTGPALYNLVQLPSRAPVILRHVWSKVLAVPASAEALARIDWSDFPGSILDRGSFWLGYYHAQKKALDAARDDRLEPA